MSGKATTTTATAIAAYTAVRERRRLLRRRLARGPLRDAFTSSWGAMALVALVTTGASPDEGDLHDGDAERYEEQDHAHRVSQARVELHEALVVNVVEGGSSSSVGPAVGEHVNLGEGLQPGEGRDHPNEHIAPAQQRPTHVAEPRPRSCPVHAGCFDDVDGQGLERR